MSKPPELENHPIPGPHRLLPQSPEAERGSLCSFLLAPQEIGGLCAERGITPEHFHLPAHALIYQSLMELWETRGIAAEIDEQHRARGRPPPHPRPSFSSSSSIERRSHPLRAVFSNQAGDADNPRI